ncbi:uncharacterized protein Dyak_GE27596, partial [Drosophila yakuba]
MDPGPRPVPPHRHPSVGGGDSVRETLLSKRLPRSSASLQPHLQGWSGSCLRGRLLPQRSQLPAVALLLRSIGYHAERVTNSYKYLILKFLN